MILIYNLLFLLLAIILSPVIAILFAIKPKLRAGFFTKIGFYKNLSITNGSIWIHAVSVGEINAVEALIKRISKEFPDYKIVVTTVTRTGQELALKKLSEFAEITYFPYDFDLAINSAIKALNPKLVIIAETEIWPAFSSIVNKNKIPLMIVNGRISPSSYKGYKKIAFFFKNILRKYNLILAQTEGDKSRLVDIGANPNTTQIMGNLKFDILGNKESNLTLKEQLNINNEKIIIAGSTHKGEDELILDCYKELKKDINNLKLILAPRHPERLNTIKKLIETYELKYGTRSNKDSFTDNDLILVDTIGELAKLYSIANVAFIGGSFSKTGGHNPLEAAVYNIPVISGPDVFNFKDIYRFMTEKNCAIIINEPSKLLVTIKNLLTDNNLYEKISSNCKIIFQENSGAVDFAIDKIKTLLK